MLPGLWDIISPAREHLGVFLPRTTLQGGPCRLLELVNLHSFCFV